MKSNYWEQQESFRSGTSTTDGIHIVKCKHEITDKMEKPAYTLFIDLTAAFNNRDRDLMNEY